MKRKLSGLLILLVLGAMANTALAYDYPIEPNPVCVYGIR